MTPEDTRDVCDYCYSAFPLVVKPKKTYELWHDALEHYDLDIAMLAAREVMTRKLVAPPVPGDVREIIQKHLTVLARQFSPDIAPPHSIAPSEVCARTWAENPKAAQILKKKNQSTDGGDQ